MVDNEIYRKLAAQYEEEYLEDMRDLNVQMPDVLTRVTEFVPEIISYVQKIIQNEFAYVSNGSVYFDTSKFAQHKDHDYGKLEPWSVGLDKLLEEGEGNQIFNFLFIFYLFILIYLFLFIFHFFILFFILIIYLLFFFFRCSFNKDRR